MGNYTPNLFMIQPIYDSIHPFATPIIIGPSSLLVAKRKLIDRNCSVLLKDHIINVAKRSWLIEIVYHIINVAKRS